MITTKPGIEKWIGRRKNVALREVAGVSLAPGVRLPGELRQWKPKVVMEVAGSLMRWGCGRSGLAGAGGGSAGGGRLNRTPGGGGKGTGVLADSGGSRSTAAQKCCCGWWMGTGGKGGMGHGMGREQSGLMG